MASNLELNASDESNKTYWRAAGDLEDQVGPHQPEPEFLSSPTREGEVDGLSDSSRRTFMKIMGASFALLGTSACTRRPVEKIVPFHRKPEDVTLGVPQYFASSCVECSSGCGTVVKSREGRPIKIEGNPKHPLSQGGLCARGQASVLNLYDPDRLRTPVLPARKGASNEGKWADIDGALGTALSALKQSGSIRILTSESTSPTRRKLIKEFLSAFKDGKHVVYEPLALEEVGLAGEITFSSRTAPRLVLDKADYILSFGADFLGNWGDPISYSKAFSKVRRVGSTAEQGRTKKMAKFVAFESMMTITGSNADLRLPVKSGDEVRIALAILHELVIGQGKTALASDAEFKKILGGYAPSVVAAECGLSADAIRDVANQLFENRTRGLVVGAGHNLKGDAGVALEVTVNLLNAALGNDGVTVDGTENVSPIHSSWNDLQQLVADMKLGKIDVLFIQDFNPIFALPKALGFEEALSKVKKVVVFSAYLDETAQKADYVLSTPHGLEVWGDVENNTALLSVVQPTIRPLYSNRSFEDSLLALGQAAGGLFAGVASYHEYLKNTWKTQYAPQHSGGKSFDLFWEDTLRDGFVGKVSSSGKSRAINLGSVKGFLGQLAKRESGFSVVVYPNMAQYDGRHANNGWLQELPDPITKVTWDNYAAISSGTAKKMGVKEGDVVKVAVGAESVDLPAYIQPGLHDETIALQMGYGRTAAGRVGNAIGVNVQNLGQIGTRALQWGALKSSISKTGRTSKLATTQKHHSIEGRAVVKEASLAAYAKDSHAGNKGHEEDLTLWPKHDYSGYRWMMAIDLNACTGCSACIIACQSENNIPIVGKEFVSSSREMHWLRIDRYYSGRADQPEVIHQPMMCQHCENAPCETVCPVLATMHDHEGINQQVYNRCVGTRYCANNCPYKVRRFNWFTFTDVAAPQNLAYNPEVTVRTRGVMEKCTFCIQRVIEVKDKAKDHSRKVMDGEVKTACQQSCPTDAIVFGDINDKASRVNAVSKDPRGFHVLHELNVKPSVTYLTKIRNT